LVRYGSRQISFLTLNPFKWCAIFQNYRRSVAIRYGMLGYGMVRYGALKFRISSHSLLYTNHNTVNTRKYVHGVISEKKSYLDISKFIQKLVDPVFDSCTTLYIFKFLFGDRTKYQMQLPS
jgi:hypothetical protein